ncbi:hypothetical protein ES702_07188 [subsurface metagenome]
MGIEQIFEQIVKNLLDLRVYCIWEDVSGETIGGIKPEVAKGFKVAIADNPKLQKRYARHIKDNHFGTPYAAIIDFCKFFRKEIHR